MRAKDTLWHVNFGDNDNSFVIAPDEETARERMPDGKDMVNYAVRMDALYQQIFKAGMKEVVDLIDTELEESDSRNMWYLNKTFWRTAIRSLQKGEMPE